MAIQQDNSTTFRDEGFKPVADMTAIMGGSDPQKFAPNLNLSFAACSGAERHFLNLNRTSVTSAGQRLTFEGGKARFESKASEHDEFTLAPDGSLKWNVILLAKPASNVLSWALTHSANLSFFHQPALTAKEIAEGHERPDRIVGSYAVYANQSGHVLDGKGGTLLNYRSGKVAHLMRPLVKDADANEAWGTLSIAAGVLSVTIPQAFLDTATYPVTLDPEFGYNSASTPGSAVGISTFDYCHDADPAPYTASSGDTATKFSVYCRTPSDGGVSAALYTHDGSLPDSRLAAGVAINGIDGTAAWRDSSAISQALSDGVDYVLAVGALSGTAVNIYYDSGSAGARSRDNSGTLAATWTNNAGGSNVFGWYTTYTTGGGGGSGPPGLTLLGTGL